MTEQALTQFVNTNRRQLIGFAAHIVRNHEMATDAVSDAYLKALRKRETFNNEPTPRAISVWFYRVLRNTCADLVKSDLRRPCVGIPDLIVEPATIDQAFDAVDDADRIRRAFEFLNESERQVVTMIAEGITINDVSASTGLRVPAIKNIVSRLRRAVGYRYEAVHAVAGVA
jgi:RNA polymerase sigma factor (sigma-70 family)